jgi:hypothetical protein
MDRTSPARQRPNATARASASKNVSRPWAAARVLSSANSGPSRVFPAAAAPVMNASAVSPCAQNVFSAMVFGRTARRGAGRGPP